MLLRNLCHCTSREVGQNWHFIKIIRFLHHLKALNERISEWAHFQNLAKRCRRYWILVLQKTGKTGERQNRQIVGGTNWLINTLRVCQWSRLFLLSYILYLLDGLHLFWFRKLARIRVNLAGKKQDEHKSCQIKASFSDDESLGESQNII